MSLNICCLLNDKLIVSSSKGRTVYDSGMADQFPVIAVSEDTLFNKTGARVTGQKKKKAPWTPDSGSMMVVHISLLGRLLLQLANASLILFFFLKLVLL